MSDLKYIGKNILNHDLILKKGHVSGSAASTGSFGRVEATVIGGNSPLRIESDSFILSNDGTVSGSVVSTGSFGRLEIAGNSTLTGDVTIGGNINIGDADTDSLTISADLTSNLVPNADSTYDIGSLTKNWKVGHIEQISSTNITASSDISSSGNVTAESFTGIFQGALSGSAQIASNISGAFAEASASFASDINNLQSDSASFSTRVTDLKSDSGSFSTRVTDLKSDSGSFSTRITNFSTGNVELVSGSASSTGSFGNIVTNTGGIYRYGVQALSNFSSDINTAAVDGRGGGILIENTHSSGRSILRMRGGSGISHLLFGENNSTDEFHISPRNQTSNIFKMDSVGDITVPGDITLSGTGTGAGDGDIIAAGKIQAEGNISGSATSTGSFGDVMVANNLALGGDPIYNVGTTGANLTITANNPYINLNDSNSTSGTRVFSIGSDNNKLKFAKMTDDGGTKVEQFLMNGNGNFSMGDGSGNLVEHTNSTGGNLTLDGNNPALNLYDNNASSGARNKAILSMGGALYIGKTADDGTSAVHHIVIDDSGNVEVPVGNISGSATSTGSFGNLRIAGMSVSDVTVFSSSLSTRITADSSSFAARDTLSETTSSKILNGELEFTNITGSGHISMSLSSTGSFGRLEATTIGGHSPLSIDSVSTFKEHTIFTNYISASSTSTLDLKGQLLIQTGSILGDLHIRTNESLMRFGKATSGLTISGSTQVSRFATADDGSTIDLGFTITDEDGDEVVSGDGDGIHVDSNNYWYNNTFHKVGDGSKNYLQYDGKGMKYYGKLYAQTGSIDGELYIKSPTGSMFIGKYTGGFNVSGLGGASRYATGSDGGIIDLGFTVVDEEGATQVVATGDGLYVDDNSYWYTTGNFRVGDGSKQIDWNKQSLTISASSVDVTTLKASDVNFSNLPTSDPLVTGSLWVSGSSTSGSYSSGFVMISGIHG